jgi:hypothetical protein
MSDETTTTEEDSAEEGPAQTVKRMPDDQPDIGPFFPSGMSAPEAALAGATANMSDEQVAALKGEEAEAPAEEEPE